MVTYWKSSAMGTILDKGARLRHGALTTWFHRKGKRRAGKPQGF